MIDYDATLKKFFAEVVLFLEKRKKQAKDDVELQRVISAIGIVNAVAENPRKYADYAVRVKENLVEPAEAFMPNPYDNSVFLIYNKVLANLSDLYCQFDYHRHEAQKVLLDGLKQMKYKNATNILKDFYFPFISAARYAVKKTK